MTKPSKLKILLTMGVMALLLVLLTASLPALQMEPGKIFSLQTSDPLTVSSQIPDNINWFFVLTQGFLAFLILLFSIHIIISLLSKEGIRKLLMDILKFAVIFLAVMWLSEKEMPFAAPDNLAMLQPGFADMAEISIDPATPPSFESDPQPWMLKLIIVGAAALLAVLTFFVMRYLSKRKTVERPQFQELAENAQTALEAIEEAQINFNDVIIRCYAEMSETLRAESDIQRTQAMTTHEFEIELLSKGFPAQPVQRLTQLFEQVRYGRQTPRENDKRLAIESLTEIVAFCKGGA